MWRVVLLAITITLTALMAVIVASTVPTIAADTLGLAMPGAPFELGSYATGVTVRFDCWEQRDYITSCTLLNTRNTAITIHSFLGNNRIVKLTYEADNLFHLLELVQHLGPGTILARVKSDIYIRWDDGIRGIISRRHRADMLDYGLTVWRSPG